VIAGQAFHWFDPERFRAEVLRILNPGSTLVATKFRPRSNFLEDW